MDSTESSESAHKDGRSDKRYPVDLQAEVTNGDETREERIYNMSLGGALLSCNERLPLGTNVKLRFRIPNMSGDIEVEAVVRWSSEDTSGVQFQGLRAREVWSLNDFFKHL